ncbi:hypothetical protein SARC_12416, partial [Sphaeroforma arctica JP610]
RFFNSSLTFLPLSLSLRAPCLSSPTATGKASTANGQNSTAVPTVATLQPIVAI